MANLRDKIAVAAFEAVCPNQTMLWRDACLYERAADAILAIPEIAQAQARAEAAEAAIARAYHMGLEAAATEADKTSTCILPSGHFLSERCGTAIRALTPPADLAEQCKKGTE